MALHEAVAGVIQSASGISSPVHGYRFEVKFRTTDLSFAPGQLTLAWAGSFRKMDARFKIPEAPLK